MSEVITDKLTGRATAGDVTITSGTTTMQLQEGVAVVYFTVSTFGTAAVNQSNNVTSLVDSGTGHFKLNFTNNMSNDEWSAAVCGGDVAYNLNHRAYGNATLGPTTAKGEFASRDMGNVARDTPGNTGSIFGGLA